MYSMVDQVSSKFIYSEEINGATQSAKFVQKFFIIIQLKRKYVESNIYRS